jgi:hypothetical protein
MLEGNLAFRRKTFTDKLAYVTKEESERQQLPSAPPHARVLLRRCLQNKVAVMLNRTALLKT